MNDVCKILPCRIFLFCFVKKLLNYENMIFFPITLIPDRQQKLSTEARSGAIENQMYSKFGISCSVKSKQMTCHLLYYPTYCLKGNN